MDSAAAINRHREPLLRIVAALFSMIGFVDHGSIEQLKRPLYRKVLALLRPAEAAVRRLIVFAARDLVAKVHAARRTRTKATTASKRQTKSKRRVCFQLLDPIARPGRRHSSRFIKAPRAEPRIHFFDDDPRVPSFLRAPPPPPVPAPVIKKDTVNAARLCRRLAAIKDALQDLPRQAKRYARLRAKAHVENRSALDEKLRLRRLPFLVRKTKHEVHDILSECDWLARTTLTHNTS